MAAAPEVGKGGWLGKRGAKLGAMTGSFNERYLELQATEEAVSLFFYKAKGRKRAGTNTATKTGMQFKEEITMVFCCFKADGRALAQAGQFGVATHANTATQHSCHYCVQDNKTTVVAFKAKTKMG